MAQVPDFPILKRARFRGSADWMPIRCFHANHQRMEQVFDDLGKNADASTADRPRSSGSPTVSNCPRARPMRWAGATWHARVRPRRAGRRSRGNGVFYDSLVERTSKLRLRSVDRGAGGGRVAVKAKRRWDGVLDGKTWGGRTCWGRRFGERSARSVPKS